MSVHFINEFSSPPTITEEDIANAEYHAEQGNAEAQYHLALMYDTGNGVERNPKEAEKWYKMAAEQGHADAQYYLAHLYTAQTSGIRRNEQEARKLLQAAAAQGHVGAIQKIAN